MPAARCEVAILVFSVTDVVEEGEAEGVKECRQGVGIEAEQPRFGGRELLLQFA